MQTGNSGAITQSFSGSLKLGSSLALAFVTDGSTSVGFNDPGNEIHNCPPRAGKVQLRCVRPLT